MFVVRRKGIKFFLCHNHTSDRNTILAARICTCAVLVVQGEIFLVECSHLSSFRLGAYLSSGSHVRPLDIRDGVSSSFVGSGMLISRPSEDAFDKYFYE